MSNYELYHWGVKGMKWGVRRYQNEDGSLTDAGRKRYIDQSTGKLTKAGEKRLRAVGENSNEGKHIRAERQSIDVDKNWLKSYNKASNVFNREIQKINEKFGDDAHTGNKEYIQAVGKMWKDAYSKALLKDFGPEVMTGGKDWVNNAPFMDSYDYDEWGY